MPEERFCSHTRTHARNTTMKQRIEDAAARCSVWKRFQAWHHHSYQLFSPLLCKRSSQAAYYPETPTQRQQDDMAHMIRTFAEFYPCKYCVPDLRRYVEEHPPQTQSREAFSQWTCRLHNSVNKKLHKRTFDCTRFAERWRTGCQEEAEEDDDE
jgi:hypothetical protein